MTWRPELSGIARGGNSAHKGRLWPESRTAWRLAMSDIITACVAGGSERVQRWDGYHTQRITSVSHRSVHHHTHGAEVVKCSYFQKIIVSSQDTNSGWANGENGGPTKTQAGVCNLELLL